MSVLAVGAHPDDLEILAGGTLARLAAEGHDIHLHVLTDGALGADHADVTRTRATRRAEAEASAAVLGATLHWTGAPDGFLFDDRDLRLEMVEVIRRAAPDLMIVHSPRDYHPDHRVAGAVAIDARLLGHCRALETAGAPTARAPAVWIMDSLGGAAAAQRWVDVGDHVATKNAMIRCHRSQNDLTRATDGYDYVELADTQGHARGLQCGVAYAECFTSVTTFPAASETALPGARARSTGEELITCAESWATWVGVPPRTSS